MDVGKIIHVMLFLGNLLEDISMLMMDGHETLSYYQKIIDDKEQAVLSSKTLSNGRTAVLMVDKTEEYFIHILQQVLKYNNYDYGFGDSYHMCNWLWHGFAMQSICDKTIWIDLPNLNSYMLKHFDLELQYLNTKIPRDKHLLNNAINKSRFRDPIHNYLINETNLYDIIMKYRNEDYTLKDLKENPIDAEKISNAVFNEYNNIQNIKQKEEIVRQFIWLIFQKHWGQN